MTLQNFTLGTFAQQGVAAAGSFESIATVVVSTSTGTIDFTSIPTNYAHLQLRMYHTFSAANLGMNIQLGTGGSIDTGGNYSLHDLVGSGTSAGSFFNTGQNNIYFYSVVGNASTAIPEVEIVDILDYTNTNKNKVIRSLYGVDNNGSGEVHLLSGLWQNTGAISNIRIRTSSNLFTSGSHFALYGIKAA